MNDYDALAAGLNTNLDYVHDISPEDAGITDETLSMLFKAGKELVLGKFLIISCDSSFEYKRDIKVYNDAAALVNEHFNALVAEPFTTVYEDNCWAIRLGPGGDGEIPVLVPMNPNAAAVPPFKQQSLDSIFGQTDTE